MCTIGFHGGLGILFKNRDKQRRCAETIVHAGEVLACKTVGADYWSWAMNRHGLGFVSAAVNSPAWCRQVYAGRLEEADAIQRDEAAGLAPPAVALGKVLPACRKLDELVDAVVSAPFASMGYNVVVSDGDRAALVEAFQSQRRVRRLAEREAVTNHFRDISHGPAAPSDYPSSFRRLDYANDRLGPASSLPAVFEMLKPSAPEDQRAVWRCGAFSTISTSVLGLREQAAYYSAEMRSPYERIAFDDVRR